jgi:hypothetical protein
MKTLILIRVLSIILLIISCERIENETDPAKIIIGKWRIVEMGNWPNMEAVEQQSGYDEYLSDSIKLEYSSNSKEPMQKIYWIDSLLNECIYDQDEHRYFNTGRFKYEFFHKNNKMRLDLKGMPIIKTFIFKRIK